MATFLLLEDRQAEARKKTKPLREKGHIVELIFSKITVLVTPFFVKFVLLPYIIMLMESPCMASTGAILSNIGGVRSGCK